MENAEPKKKKNIGCLVVIVILALIVIITLASGGGDDSKTTSGDSLVTWTSAEVTVDTVKTALAGKAPISLVLADSSYYQNITDVQVVNHQNNGKKNILVYYKSGTVWDETDMVKRSAGTAILIYSILYQNPQVEQVAVFAQTDMTDQYGKTSTETGVKIVLNRETADKIDWKGLADRHTTDPGNIYRLAENYYVHPGILKNVKLDEVKLR